VEGLPMGPVAIGNSFADGTMTFLPMGGCRWPHHFAVGNLSADGERWFADGFKPSANSLDPVVLNIKTYKPFTCLRKKTI